MVKMKRAISICMAFMLMYSVFNCFSMNVVAADTEKDVGIIVVESSNINCGIEVTSGSGVKIKGSIENHSGLPLTPSGATTIANTIAQDATENFTIDVPYDEQVDHVTRTISLVANNGYTFGINFDINWVSNPTPSGGGDSSSASNTTDDSSSASNTTESHTHSYSWEDVRPATEDENGEMVYRCSCGEVLYRVPTSAYYVFNKNAQDKIKNAKQGATVKIETSRWISFHKMVLQALADRPDVSLEVSFLDGEYKGNRVSFTIPAGTDTLSLLDENGFSGFLFLAGKFGTAN